jgi:hypothetical protein
MCPTLVGPKGWAMVFGLKSRSAQDDQPRGDTGERPYRLASYEHDYEGKKFKSSQVVYSFWSAAKYTLVLSIVLWWLPLFGQMIAGYVGGRRAGGPWKGVAAAIVPVACLYIVMSGFDSGFFPSHLFGVAVAPAAVSASLSESVPFISPYIQFSSEYVGSFVAALAGSSPYGINTYVVTVAFAYVGGILAEQSRREIEYSSGSMMSNTTVLVHENNRERFHPYPEPARPGLAHMISSHLPWSHEHARPGSHQHVYALPPARGVGAGGWQYANQAAFQEGENGTGSERGAEHPTRAGSRRHHNSPGRDSKKGEPWQRSERRVKHHYSSARRFAASPGPDLARPVRSRAARQTRRPNATAGRPSRGSSIRFTPADQKSVRKARKAIEKEWGGRSRFVAHTRPRVDFADDEDFVDTQPSPRSNHDSARHHRSPQKQRWDTI